MIDEVEVDLEAAHAVRNGRGRQSARGDVQCDMPGMIEPRRAREPDLADDLGAQMQRFVSVAPRRGRQLRPWGLRRIAHASPSHFVMGSSRNTKAGHDPARPLYANAERLRMGSLTSSFRP